MPYRHAQAPREYRELPSPIHAPPLPAAPPEVVLPDAPRALRPGLQKLADKLRQILDPDGGPKPLLVRVARGDESLSAQVEFSWLSLLGAPTHFAATLIHGPEVTPRALRLVGHELRAAWKEHFAGLERSRVFHRAQRLDLDKRAQAALADGGDERCPRCDAASYHRKETHEYQAGGLTWRQLAERCGACAFARLREEGVCARCRGRMLPDLHASRANAIVLQSDEDGIVRREAAVWRCLVCGDPWSEARVIIHGGRE